jgi:hypothetical protein
MRRIAAFFVLAYLVLGVVLGCSSRSNSPPTKQGEDNPAIPAEPGRQMVGVWEGPCSTAPISEFGIACYEIKDDGRYRASFSRTGTSLTGTWKVTGTDRELILAQVTNDLQPGKSFGWRVTVKGNDEIELEQGYLTVKLKRTK